MDFDKALGREKSLEKDNLDLFEMSNIRPEYTGLTMVIYIGPQFNPKHGPRIKVSTTYGEKVGSSFFVITINDEPKVIGDTGDIKQTDVSKAKEFIKLNKETLLQLWRDEIDPKKATEEFVKVT
jgi:hypothetical protein